MGRLVTIKFPVTLWIVHPGSPYIRCDTSNRTSNLETVCPLQGFQGEPHFSSFVLLFSNSTLKTIKGLPKVF
jgi:hypothetical protein